ncbi:MAG: hypothetical protein IJX78_04100 [Bacilli bacterium]|nr:hypothetical protein [Bacilli bacterium]
MESIKIAGAGVVLGGEYDEVSVAGSAKVKGFVKCNVFKTSGATSIDSSIEAETFKTSGSIKIEGSLKANEIKIAGAARIEGSVESESFNASGSLVVEGDINTDVLKLSITNGSFENIYGDEICINSDGKFINEYFHDVVKNISVKEIEATSICLKDVTAERVSGDSVTLEAGCKIGVVEYSKSLNISTKVKVERIIKL